MTAPPVTLAYEPHPIVGNLVGATHGPDETQRQHVRQKLQQLAIVMGWDTPIYDPADGSPSCSYVWLGVGQAYKTTDDNLLGATRSLLETIYRSVSFDGFTSEQTAAFRAAYQATEGDPDKLVRRRDRIVVQTHGDLDLPEARAEITRLVGVLAQESLWVERHASGKAKAESKVERLETELAQVKADKANGWASVHQLRERVAAHLASLPHCGCGALATHVMDRDDDTVWPLCPAHLLTFKVVPLEHATTAIALLELVPEARKTTRDDTHCDHCGAELPPQGGCVEGSCGDARLAADL